MDNQSTKSNESVTLVLRDHRVTANKDKLACNSLYFASLFSENFKDHHQKEFAINYEMSLGTLQDFVNWANEEGKDSNSIDSVKYNFTAKKSLQKFLTGNRSELLELLELSVVFMAETLTADIVHMIICMRFPPDDMLEVWLLAENLGLKGLEDAALAICLDRFNELTASSLVDLSLEHFSKLVCNDNVRSSIDRLMTIREAWRDRNDLPTNTLDSKSRFIKGEPDEIITALKEAKPHYSQCVVGHKLNKAQFIYSWNGETLREIAEVDKEIIARQVAARGFNIYVIGRKKGDVTHFSTTIWRYCLFTKKWYTETILPRRRRNMTAAFLENKLHLFGGMDPDGQTISSVDVYNVHTGEWSKAARLPETRRLTEIRSSCVADGKFLYQKSQVHLYEPATDIWKGYHVWGPPISNRVGREFAQIQLLIGMYVQPGIVSPVVYVRNWLPQSQRSTLGLFTLASERFVHIKVIHHWGKAPIDQQVLNGPHLVSFGYRDGKATVEVGIVNQTPGTENTATYGRTKVYTQELCDVPANCFQLNMGCFNLIEPETLHATITVPELIDIGNDFTPVQRKRRMKEPEKLKRLK